MQDIPDKSILQKVNQRLWRMGGAQGKVNASISRGEVTLSGTIQYEMQRASIMKVATSVPGVRRVLDQLRLKPKEKKFASHEQTTYVPGSLASGSPISISQANSSPTTRAAANIPQTGESQTS